MPISKLPHPPVNPPTTPTLGEVRSVTVGPNMRLDVQAVYTKDGDDITMSFHVTTWTREGTTMMDLPAVRALLAAFGGTSNEW